jgi:hypothetical protein
MSGRKEKLILEEIGHVTEIMKKNGEKLVNNITALEELNTKTAEMKVHSEQFGEGASKLKKTMWWNNVKAKIVIGLVIIVVVVIVVVVIAVSVA